MPVRSNAARRRSRTRVQWEIHREEFARRRAAGERLTPSSYAKEKGLVIRTVTKRAKLDDWDGRAIELTRELNRKAWDAVEIDQVKARKAQLASGLRLAETLMATAEMLDRRIREQLQKGVVPPMKDVRLMQQMVSQLLVDGAGLPKEHKVTVDDHHEDVVLNREQQRELQEKVVRIKEWAKAKGVGPYAKERKRGGS